MEPVLLTMEEKKEIICPEEELSDNPGDFRQEIEERLSPLDMDFDYSQPRTLSSSGDKSSISILILKATCVSFYRRFIELLPSLPLRLFSFTRKESYIDCLTLRGLEVEMLFYGKDPYLMPYHPRICPAENGKLYADIQALPPRLLPYLRTVCFSYSSEIDRADVFMDIPRNYKYLMLEWRSDVPLLYIYPGIKSATLAGDLHHLNLPKFFQKLNDIEELELLVLTPRPLFSPIVDWLNRKPAPMRKFLLVYMRVDQPELNVLQATLRGNKLIETLFQNPLKRCLATTTNQLFQ